MADPFSAYRRILIVGARGQIGSSLVARIPAGNRVELSRAELDLTETAKIGDAFARAAPDCVINASGYTQVDLAEKNEALAYTINAEAPAQMALWCQNAGVPFVHYSTDYVFNGDGTRPHLESEPVAPLNVYGRSKATGERMIAETGGSFLILRTSWVFHEAGQNFVRTMVKLLQEREQIRVVSDQTGAPTYAPHLAEGTLATLATFSKNAIFPSGIYHLTNTGETTWHQFTLRIAEELRARGKKVTTTDITPITAAEYRAPAVRPLNSRLDLNKLKSASGVMLPHWENGLTECMGKLFQ